MYSINAQQLTICMANSNFMHKENMSFQLKTVNITNEQ